MSLNTGFKKLDLLINGLNEGELICIASRPGLGKTTLSTSIANNISNQKDNKIIFISLDSSKEQLKKRIKSSNIEIIDNKVYLDEIEDTCRNMNYPISLIIIDYLQLIKKTINQENVIEKIKLLALELNAPIILISQLSRYNGTKPTLLDVSNTSNELVQTSDKVITIYKDNEIPKLNLIKNSKGPIGEIKLLYNKEKLSFEEQIPLLTSILNDNNYYNDIKSLKLILHLLKYEELLLPFYNNHIGSLYAKEDKIYIPLFTDELQVKDIEYTRLDKVKLEIVIKDIYRPDKYYAISINPFTHDFIMNDKMIDLFNKLN